MEPALNPEGFSDAETGGPLRLELLSIDGHRFAMLRRIVYDDARYDESFIVPADLASFRTDLASVPAFFTWLVPRSGIFLPAAALHDGLVRPGAYLGPPIDRAEADQIFRRAMRGLGTAPIQAWLMWSAVTMATMWGWPRHRWYWRGVLLALIGGVVALGVFSTGDLLGWWDGAPWVPETSTTFLARLAGGAAGALLIPAVLALSWGRFAGAGMIVGIALAFLLHVTIAIVAVYSIYWMLERVATAWTNRKKPKMYT